MNLASLLAVLTVVVGIPLNLYVTFRLYRLYIAKPYLRVLRERVIVAVLVLLIVVVFGLIFLNNDQPIPPFDLATTKIVTRGAILALGIVPAAYWLWLYRRS